MEQTLRVLVADDEAGMRMGVKRALRQFRAAFPDLDAEVAFTVEEASTGEAAVEAIEAHPCDILLLDYKFPGMSGLQVLERVQALGLDMIVIMITAYASIETAIVATKRGAFDFLPKPFTPEELKDSLRRAADQLLTYRQARRLAEEKRQVRFEFISVLAHELKAPLAAIEGYLNILHERVAGESIEAYDRVIDRSLVRLDGMRKLIFDLLDLTRIESGQKTRHFQETDLMEIASMAVEGVSARAAERGIHIRLNGPEQARLSADPGEIEIVFNNLLTNAVKYNRDQGSVDVEVSIDERKIRIAVSDTGIGMTKDECRRLFGEFVRIKNRKTTGIAGSGLGLSIVKRLAVLYGGEVSVQSTPDVGSTFIVTLCRDTAPELQGREKTEAS